MSQLHLTATVAAGLILGVFGLASYFLDGRPFHAPMPAAYWDGDTGDTGGQKYLTLEDIAAPSGVQPVFHTAP